MGTHGLSDSPSTNVFMRMAYFVRNRPLLSLVAICGSFYFASIPLGVTIIPLAPEAEEMEQGNVRACRTVFVDAQTSIREQFKSDRLWAVVPQSLDFTDKKD